MACLPDAFVGFIALYCMGLFSEIYRRAKRTRLSVFAMLHSAAARFMLAEVAFRGLIGGIWQGSAVTLGGLTPSMLLSHMKEVFHDHMMDGTLPEEELRRMSAVIFDGMDKKKAGEISCTEFIHALTDDGNIDVCQMAKMFGTDSMPGVQRLGKLVGRHLDSGYEQQLLAAASPSAYASPITDSIRGAPTPRHSREFAASDSDIPAACMDEMDRGDPELRLAALEELGRRMESRVTALERNQQDVAAIDVEAVARDCLFISNTAGIVETLHSEFQTFRNDLETRLRVFEQVFQLVNYHQQCQLSRGSEQSQEPGKVLFDDHLQATSKHAVELGKIENNTPKPNTSGSTSGKILASPKMHCVSAAGGQKSIGNEQGKQQPCNTQKSIGKGLDKKRPGHWRFTSLQLSPRTLSDNATPENEVEPGKTESNTPKPSMVGSASRKMLGSPRMRSGSEAGGAARGMLLSPKTRSVRGQLSPSRLSPNGQTSCPPSHFSVQCQHAAALGGGFQRDESLVTVERSCREVVRLRSRSLQRELSPPVKPQLQKGSVPIKPALEGSPRLFQHGQRHSRENMINKR